MRIGLGLQSQPKCLPPGVMRGIAGSVGFVMAYRLK